MSITSKKQRTCSGLGSTLGVKDCPRSRTIFEQNLLITGVDLLRGDTGTRGIVYYAEIKRDLIEYMSVGVMKD